MALREQTKISRGLLLTLGVLILIVVGFVVWSKSRGGSSSLFSFADEEFLDEQPAVVLLNLSKVLRPELQVLEGEVGGVRAQQVKGVSTNPRLPLAPEDIQVFDPKTGALLNLFWSPPVAGEVKTYRVYRSDSEGVLGELLVDQIPETLYQDRQVEKGAIYFYTVHAVNANGDESKNTKQYAASPSDAQAPGSPMNVSVQDASEGGELELSWDNPRDSDFVGVNIYKSEVEGALGTQIKTRLSNTTSYRDDDVVDGTSYFYTVTAVDGQGNESATALAKVASGRLNPFIPSVQSNE